MTQNDQPGTVVVVGYGPGIGEAVTRKFAALGYRPVLVARDGPKLEKAVAALRAQGIEASAEDADIADLRHFTEVLAGVRARERVEILVYNAAAFRPGPLLEIGPAAFETDFRVCVTGALVSAQTFAPGMVERRRGSLLFTGGGLALHPSSSVPTLSIGKGAIRSLAMMLAEDLVPVGVRAGTVTVMGTVAPGTPFAPERVADAFAQLHRSPPDAATAEVFLRDS